MYYPPRRFIELFEARNERRQCIHVYLLIATQ